MAQTREALHRSFGRSMPAVLRSLPGWITALASYSLMVYGAWLAYAPLGFILGGVLLIPLERSSEWVWQASRR